MTLLAQAAEGSTVLAGVVVTVVGALQLIVMFVLRWMRAVQLALQDRVKSLETEVASCHEERFRISTEVGILKSQIGQLASG